MDKNEAVEITQADRDALEAIDDALGFLMDNERAIVLDAFARHRLAAQSQPAATVQEVGRDVMIGQLIAQYDEGAAGCMMDADDAQALAHEFKRMQGLIYCPGVLRCAKCDFRLIKTTLTPAGAFANEEPDRCPNCNVPMWRVTWQDEAKEAYKVAESQMGRALEAEQKLAALSPSKAVEPAPEQGEADDVRLVCEQCGKFGLFYCEHTARGAERLAHPSPAPQQPQSEAQDGKVDWEAWATEWHRCVETILTMAGLSPALGASEALEAMQAYITKAEAAQPQSEKMLREALELCREVLPRFVHSVSDEDKHVAGRTALKAVLAALTPKGEAE